MYNFNDIFFYWFLIQYFQIVCVGGYTGYYRVVEDLHDPVERTKRCDSAPS